jgi:D-3-phosphoglycerate dehydrogenase / 2-oxoglutarate reductase
VSKPPVLLVLSGTCLDVVESQRQWVESLGVELHADQANRHLTYDQMGEAFKHCDGAVLPSSTVPDAAQMAAAPRLRVCAIAASGFERFDLEAATRNGIVVANAIGGEGAEVVADFTWGLILAAARQIVHHHNRLSRGDLTRGMGTGVTRKTLGIIGLGAIGKQVALRAKGFAMRVLAHDPYADKKFAAEHNIELTTLDRLLAESDFLSLHTRLTDETRGIIGAKELARMKPTAYLINTARQELIDEAALVAAIQGGRLAGAGLDDPPGPAGQVLFGHPSVVFTTHLGNRSVDGMIAVLRAAVESAVAVFRGQRPRLVVNPEVYERGLRQPL